MTTIHVIPIVVHWQSHPGSAVGLRVSEDWTAATFAICFSWTISYSSAAPHSCQAFSANAVEFSLILMLQLRHLQSIA